MFGEIFKVLVEVIEFKTRVKLAERFAVDPIRLPASHVPLPRAIAADVAAPVLTQSTALAESDLIASARPQSQDHLYAIAQRQSMSEAVTDILIERGERARRPCGREQRKRPHLRWRIWQAGPIVRRRCRACAACRRAARHSSPPLRLSFLNPPRRTCAARSSRQIRTFADAVQGAVTEVIDSINGDVRKQSQDHANARSRIKRLREWKDLREGDIHAAARAQDFERTVTALTDSRELSDRDWRNGRSSTQIRGRCR